MVRSRPDPAERLADPPVFADLHLLTVLAQTRSYTQAARRLGWSKATVSQRIAALERTMRVPLVRRTTRSVSLTAAGQELVAGTAPAFAQIEQHYSAIRDLAQVPRGRVRLTAPVALGRQHVMPALAAFAPQYPEIRVELDLNDRLCNLAQEGFDLAVRHVSQPPETHVAWPLCTTRSLLVASPDYLDRRGRPRHPQALAEHDCLVYLRAHTGVQTWTLTRMGRRSGPETCQVPVQGSITANNSEVLREAALSGLGIALLPDFSARSFVGDARRLERVLPGWQPQGFFGDRIHAIRPWSPQTPRAVQCLVQHLQAWFRERVLAPEDGEGQ